MDQEAIKALVASHVSRASEIYVRELGRGEIERIADHVAELISGQSGVFEVRRDLIVMVIQGTMEYVIFSLGIVAALFLLLGVMVYDVLKLRRQGRIV